MFAFLALATALQTQPTTQAVLCGRVTHTSWSDRAAVDAKTPVVIDLDVLMTTVAPDAPPETTPAPKGSWTLTAGTLNTLLRAGVTRDSLKDGTLIVAHVQWDGKPCAQACRAQRALYCAG